jgi:hypothetical protein
MPSSCELNKTTWAKQRQASTERERELSVRARAGKIDDRRDMAKRNPMRRKPFATVRLTGCRGWVSTDY